MKRMIKYPSIEQARGVVKQITERACYIGKDEDGKAIFDFLKPKPKLTFSVSTKLHGTNAGYVYTKKEQYYQSRENIITVEKDNMGCAFMMEQRKDILNKLCNDILSYYNIDSNKYGLVLYMELCGKGIQKNVAVSELEKMFILFEYCLLIEANTLDRVQWLKTNIYK